DRAVGRLSVQSERVEPARDRQPGSISSVATEILSRKITREARTPGQQADTASLAQPSSPRDARRAWLNGFPPFPRQRRLKHACARQPRGRGGRARALQARTA